MTSREGDSSLDTEDSWIETTRFGKFLARPCVASSFLYGTGGYFITFLGTFGWTSNWTKAYTYGGIAFAAVTLTTSTVCTFARIAREIEAAEKRKQREEETLQRRLAVEKKIEERKRMHEERKKKLENKDSVEQGST